MGLVGCHPPWLLFLHLSVPFSTTELAVEEAAHVVGEGLGEAGVLGSCPDLATEGT